MGPKFCPKNGGQIFKSEKNIPMNVGFWSNKDQIAAFVMAYNYIIAPCIHFHLLPALIYSLLQLEPTFGGFPYKMP